MLGDTEEPANVELAQVRRKLLPSPSLPPLTLVSNEPIGEGHRRSYKPRVVGIGRGPRAGYDEERRQDGHAEASA